MSEQILSETGLLEPFARYAAAAGAQVSVALGQGAAVAMASAMGAPGPALAAPVPDFRPSFGWISCR